MKLKLVHIMDISTTLDKLEAAAIYCPNLVKLELSMFNFSSYYDDIVTNMMELRPNTENRCHWIDLIFSFKHLKLCVASIGTIFFRGIIPATG